MPKKMETVTRDIYFVDWTLTGLYDRTHCLYDPGIREANTVFSRSRLLDMAGAIPFRENGACAVRFSGGEPGLHPWLPDLIHYFTGKNAWMTLATSGWGKAELYQDIARDAQAGRLALEITLLPQISDITPFLVLAGAFIEQRQHVHFRVIMTPGGGPDSRLGMLARLRQALPFTLEILPLSKAAHIGAIGAIPQEFAEASSAGPAMPADLLAKPSFWPTLDRSLAFVAGDNGNTMRIFPNGAYTYSFLDTVPAGLPLWRELRAPGTYKTCARAPKENEPDISALSQLLRQRSKGICQSFPSDPDLKRGIERVLKAAPLEHSRRIFLQGLRAVRDSPDDLSAFLVESEVPAEAGEGRTFVYEQPLRKGEISAMLGALERTRPWLSFPVQPGKPDLLEIPLAILERAPEYEFHFHRGKEGQIRISGKSRIAPLYGSVPDISVIVPTFNSEQTIERCINSILIQSSGNIEIIVVDDGSTDSTPEKLREIARIHPEIIKLSLQAQNRGPGFARNMGLSLATGKYLTFVDSDDMLAEDFLRASLDLIECEDADIVAFDQVFIDSDRLAWLQTVEPGCVSGSESLRSLLLKQAGAYAAYARLYRAELVKRHAIRFSDQVIHQDIFFSVQAFYHSRRTVITDARGYYRHLDPDSHSRSNHGKKHLESFLGVVNFLEDFFRIHGLDEDDDALRFAIRRIYDWDRRQIFAYLGNARENPEEIFTPELLDACSRSRHALLCILEDYAHLNGNSRQIFQSLAADADYPACEGPFLILPFGEADSRGAANPLISVICIVHNQAASLAAIHKGIFNQGFDDFELLLVDNGSDDGSYELAQALTESNGALRLYRMQKYAHMGACRALALEKARGKYTIFLEGEPESGFLGVAAWLAEKRKADIGCFSWQIGEGESQATGRLEDGIISSSAALELYFQNRIAPGLGPMIFRTDLIREACADYEGDAYPDEHNFIVEALRKAGVIFTSSFRAYSFPLLQVADAGFDIGDPVQGISGCRNFRTLAEQPARSGYHPLAACGRVIWNLENRNLDIWKASMDAKGELGLDEGDKADLLANGAFTASALLGLSRKYETSYNAQAQGFQYAERERSLCDWQFAEPMLSVIITVSNHEDTLQACLDAVLSQSLRSLEIIIVDDFSTDNSLRICKQYAARDKRVRIIHNEIASGKGPARNRALKEIRGSFVTFIDADSAIQPEFLLNGVTRLITINEAQFVQFEKPGMAALRRLYRAWDGSFHLETERMLELYSEGGPGFWNVEGKIYRSDFLDAAGAVFQDHIYGEDLFLLKVYSQAGLGLLCDKQAYMPIRPGKENGQHEGFGQEDLAGFMQANAEIAQFSRTVPHPFWADKCLSRRYHRYRSQMLGYLARLRHLPVGSASRAELDALQDSPGFFRALFSDYARMWSAKRPLPSSPEAQQEHSHALTPELLTIHDVSSPESRPLVSIVIPAWNTEQTLARCVESSIAQGDNIEIILIEDNSDRDATFPLARALAERSQKIRLFRTRRNSGLGNVRNLGMNVARGKYITFLDSDDWLGHGFIPSLGDMLEAGEADIISCSITRVLRNMETNQFRKPDLGQPGWQTLVELMEGKYSHWEAWGRLFRLDFLRENNICFSSYIYEDVLFHFRAFLLAKYNILSSVNSVWSDRRGLDSLMNVARRGRRFFESQIYNLKMTYEVAHELCDADLRDLLLEKYAAWIYEEANIFRKDVLTFIEACRLAGFASPLDDRTVETLLLSKPFLGRVLADMGSLWDAQ